MHKNLQDQPRRMWSDWSECSAECKKTRHRLFCDDLLEAQQQHQKPTHNISSAHLSAAAAESQSQRGRLLAIKRSSKLSKRQTDKLELQEDAKKQRDQELLFEPKVSSDQLDDDDYADVGDAEEDTDTCDRVSEREKTFELKDCQGGQCRSALNVDGLIGAKQILASSQANVKATVTGTLRQLGQKDKQERVFSRPAASTRSPNFELQSDAYADTKRRYLPGQQQYQPFHLPPKVTSSSSSSGNIQVEDNQATQHSNSNGDTSELVYGSDLALGKLATGNNNNNSNSTIWRTRNMWPPQLINGDLGTQANLIQWTILIGSLLTIVLLIMLILRKLFSAQLPSYHWMLAKQTIKSSSRMDCCAQHHNSNTLLDSSAGLGANAGMHHHHHHQQQQQHSTVHNRCRNWTPLQVDTCCPTADPSQQQQHQSYRHFVDSSGRPHLLDGLTSLQFNTDQQQLYEEPICSSGPTYTDPSLTNSNSSGRRRTNNIIPSAIKHGRAFLDNHETSESSVISANHPINNLYSYDTLPTNYNTRNNIQPSADEKAFILTRDFIMPSNQPSKHHCPQFSTTNTRHSAENNLELIYQQEEQQQHQNELRKQSSPNVPQQKNMRQDQDHLSTSRSSSTSSENDDESPLSIQSTTAQILSNAASSSFEQPAELGDLESLNSPQQHQHQFSISATASPATVAHPQNGQKPRHGSAAKLVAFQSTVQSQPNSPMFVNQFSGGKNVGSSSSSARHKRSTRSHMKLSLKDRTYSQDEQNESEYAMPEESDISIQQPHLRNQTRTSGSTSNESQVVHNLVKKLEVPTVKQCDTNERHYYEEIDQKQQQQQQPHNHTDHME